MKLDRNTVRRAKSGDIEAQEAVVAANSGRINYLASHYASFGIEFDDLVQEGLIGLFSAVERFDENEEAQFSTYAYRCITNGILSAVRSASRKKHLPLNTALPLCETITTVSTEQMAINNEQYQALRKRIDEELTRLEKQVLFAYLDGVDYRNIAKHCNITTKSVDNALFRVRKKLANRI